MRVVEFLRNWSPYNVGETAGFEDDVAFKLCNGGNPIAVEIGTRGRVVDVPAIVTDVPKPVTAAPPSPPPEAPAADAKPADEPPADAKPADEPPAAAKPADEPPAAAKPADEPPSAGKSGKAKGPRP